MRTVIVYRNGEIKCRVTAEIRNGILRHGKNILINNDLIQSAGLNKDHVVRQIKAGNITPEIEALGMHIGDNGNGLVCRWADEVRAEEEAERKAKYDALPAKVRAAREERIAIDELYYRADRSLNHDTDEDNVSRGYRLQAEADRRIKAWRERYPYAAERERVNDLRAKADREDSLAVGALTYDADGWISPEEQQRRYDAGKAAATALRAEAEQLLTSLPIDWQ